MKKSISIPGVNQLSLLGLNDENLKLIEDVFNTKIVVRGSNIILISEDEAEITQIEQIFLELIAIVERGHDVTLNDVHTLIDLVKFGKEPRKPDVKDLNLNNVILYTKDGAITPRTPGQLQFFESSRRNDIIFVTGPAGTGKTYLAIAIALAHLRDKLVSKIILARPAVEAGESLGYLPGDMLEKIEPYLRPLYDALFDMVIQSKLKKYMDSEIIEVVPLAYMRGRTLNNAFVILDEAQNTYPNQMKMFLTRLGINSKSIITGDITQIDLPDKKSSGLVQIKDILKGIEGIDFIDLTDRDVLRHRLVREIIKAYESYGKEEKQ